MQVLDSEVLKFIMIVNRTTGINPEVLTDVKVHHGRFNESHGHFVIHSAILLLFSKKVNIFTQVGAFGTTVVK